MALMPSNQNIILRLPAVIAKIGLSRSTIYAMLNPDSPQYDPTFPRPVKLSLRAIGFHSQPLDAWLASKLNGGVA